MDLRFLLKNAVVIIFLCHIPFCEQDYLETLQRSKNDPPELSDFLNSLLKTKDLFKQIRDDFKHNQHILSSKKRSIHELTKNEPLNHDSGPIYFHKRCRRRFLGKPSRPFNDVYPYSSLDEPDYLQHRREIDGDKLSSPRHKRYSHKNQELIDSYRNSFDINSVTIIPRGKVGFRKVPGSKYEDFRNILFNNPKRNWRSINKVNCHLKANQNSANRLLLTKNNDYLKRNLNNPNWQQWTKDKVHALFKKNKNPFISYKSPSFLEDWEIYPLLYNEQNLESNFKNLKRKSNTIEAQHDSEMLHRAFHLKSPYKKLHSNPSHAVDIDTLITVNPKYINEYLSKNGCCSSFKKPGCKECDQYAVVYQAKPNIIETQSQEPPRQRSNDKKVYLEDVDEPTSAIEQHELSTNNPMSGDNFLSKLDFFDITRPRSSTPFSIQESKNMIHGLHSLERSIELIKILSDKSRSLTLSPSILTTADTQTQNIKDSNDNENSDEILEDVGNFPCRKLQCLENFSNDIKVSSTSTGLLPLEDSNAIFNSNNKLKRTTLLRIERDLPNLFGMANDEDYSEDIENDFNTPTKIQRERAINENDYYTSLPLLDDLPHNNLKYDTIKRTEDDDDETKDIGSSLEKARYNKKNNEHKFKNEIFRSDEVQITSTEETKINELNNISHSYDYQNHCTCVDCKGRKLCENKECPCHVAKSITSSISKESINTLSNKKILNCTSTVTPLSITFHKKITSTTENADEAHSKEPREQANEDQITLNFNISTTTENSILSKCTDKADTLTVSSKTTETTKTIQSNGHLNKIYTKEHAKHNENEFKELPQLNNHEEISKENSMINSKELGHRIIKNTQNLNNRRLENDKSDQSEYNSNNDKLKSKIENKREIALKEFDKRVKSRTIFEENDNTPYVKLQNSIGQHLKPNHNALNMAPFENFMEASKIYKSENFKNDIEISTIDKRLKNDLSKNFDIPSIEANIHHSQETSSKVYQIQAIPKSLYLVNFKRYPRNCMPYEHNIAKARKTECNNYQQEKSQEKQTFFIKNNNVKTVQCATMPLCNTDKKLNLTSEVQNCNPCLDNSEANKEHCPVETGSCNQFENLGQLQDAVSGQLVSRIIEYTYKKIKNHEKLNSRFGCGLRRHYNYQNEMKGLNQFRNCETQNDIQRTEELLCEIMNVLNKIILDQVHRRTCKHLPPELQRYLIIITKPSREERNSADEMQVSDEGYPLPLVQSKKVKERKSESQQGEFLFDNKSAGDNCSKEEMEIEGKIAKIRDLLYKFKRMNKHCRSKVEGVECYLKQHLKMLEEILKQIECEKTSNKSCSNLKKCKRKNFKKKLKSRYCQPDLPLQNTQSQVKDTRRRNFRKREDNNFENTVSNKYKKLADAIDNFRQKRNIEERLSELFGSNRKRLIMNENCDTIRSLNEESDELITGFETGTVNSYLIK